MTALAASAPSLGFFARLKAFADNIFEPKLHTAFAALWSLSLLGNLHSISRAPAWHWNIALVVLVATVFTCLFFLRMVDEVKDYDYDVVHNPNRPLVSGLVSRADIAKYLVVFALIVLFANAALAWPLALWVAIDILYGLFQLPLERWSKAVRDNLFVNLIAVYPVNVGLSIYTLLFFLHRTGTAFEMRHGLLVAAYACAFLHFEFARKSGWPHLTPSNERLYSNYVGLGGGLALSTSCGIAAIGLALYLFAPWASSWTGYLPLLGFAPMIAGLALYAKNRTKRHSARPPAVAFLFTFYVTMLAHAIAAQPIAWGAP